MSITQEQIDDFVKGREERAATAPDGPWKTERHRVEFEHAGLRCILARNQMLAWCGYVGVPAGHPAYGMDYDDVDVSVHGGLTYAEACRAPVCHIAENDELWWLGFDCAHAGDLVPTMIELNEKIRRNFPRAPEDEYRDEAYVTAEVKSLAEQLARMAA